MIGTTLPAARTASAMIAATASPRAASIRGLPNFTPSGVIHNCSTPAADSLTILAEGSALYGEIGKRTRTGAESVFYRPSMGQTVSPALSPI